MADLNELYQGICVDFICSLCFASGINVTFQHLHYFFPPFANGHKQKKVVDLLRFFCFSFLSGGSMDRFIHLTDLIHLNWNARQQQQKKVRISAQCLHQIKHHT